jgi:flagella basal body P-ring formation protein FlgA
MRPRRPQPIRLARACLLAASACAAGAAEVTDGALDAPALRQIEALGEQASAGLAAGKARVEVEPGRLDGRLRLAPCARVEALLPAGARAWGRTRVALRCVEGPTPWNVYLPVTVRVFAPAWVANQPLPAGTVLGHEGQSVRVRTDAGQVLSGTAVGPNRVEVPL